MGHHYNPQRLLRNFQIPDQPGFIWQHDKQRDEPIRAGIKHVAQERDLYDSESEKRLNTEVEVPGGNAIDKILAKQPLMPNEQIDVVIHIGPMPKRTPAHRLWAKEISMDTMPQAIEMVRAHSDASSGATVEPAASELVLDLRRIVNSGFLCCRTLPLASTPWRKQC